MPVETNVLIALVGGFVFGFLVGWMVGLQMKQGEKKAKAKAQKKKELTAEAKAFLQEEPYEYFDVHVARIDVERGAVIGVEHHVADLVEELKAEGELRHLLRMVLLGYDDGRQKPEEIPELLEHFRKIHADQPYLAVLLDKKSMRQYLQILLADRKRAGLWPEGGLIPAIEALEQEIVGHVTQLMTSLFLQHPEKLSHILDQVLHRFERMCDEMEAAERARLEALQAPQQASAR